MHVIAPKKDIVVALEYAAAVADKKSTAPALACALLDAWPDGKLSISATDLYITISSPVAAETKKRGRFAADAKALLDRVKSLPDGPVDMETRDGSIAVRAPAARRRFSLRGIPGEDFPALPEATSAPQALMPAATLRDLLARTAFSISNDITYAALSSLLFEIVDGTAIAVSTDGHRLSTAETVGDFGKCQFSALLPKAAVAVIGRALRTASGPVGICVAPPLARFVVGSVEITVKTVDAEFPPYKQVVPATDLSGRKTATCGRAALADALRAAAIAASDRTGGVALAFANGEVAVTGEAPETGDAYDAIACDYDGPEVRLGANAKYLLDAIGCLSCDDVKINFGGDLDPIRIDGEDGTVHVVMPMRI